MDLYCRNRACEFSSRPIQVKENLLKCPKCGTPLLGGSVNLGDSTDLGAGPAPPRNDSISQPLTAGTAGEKPEKDAKKRSQRRPPEPPHAQPGPPADDPNLTRPLDGFKPGSIRKPRFVLEVIEHGQAYPVKLIDEGRTTPIYGKGAGDPRRHLADLRNTPEGVELSPVDALCGFFVQIQTPVRLAHGTRFRIGHYVIEARLPTMPPSLDPTFEPSESWFSKDLDAKGELVFLRADGSEGMRFPILQKVVIGRGGPEDGRVDIPLLDANVSRKHAVVAPGSHGLKLKNLSQSDGTFVEIKSPRILVEGDRFRLGERLLQLVRYSRSA